MPTALLSDEGVTGCECLKRRNGERVSENFGAETQALGFGRRISRRREMG